MHACACMCIHVLVVNYLVASQYQDKIHLYREYCCWENVGHIFSDWFVLGSTCNPLSQVIASKAWFSQTHMVRCFSDIYICTYLYLHKHTHTYSYYSMNTHHQL